MIQDFGKLETPMVLILESLLLTALAQKEKYLSSEIGVHSFLVAYPSREPVIT